jgi:hypothetical protein
VIGQHLILRSIARIFVVRDYLAIISTNEDGGRIVFHVPRSSRLDQWSVMPALSILFYLEYFNARRKCFEDVENQRLTYESFRARTRDWNYLTVV